MLEDRDQLVGTAKRAEDDVQSKHVAGDHPPEEPGQFDAFISYARRPEDIQFVDELTSDLTRRGKNVWVDRNDIEPASDWRARIQRGIASARSLIFVISPQSVSSEECRNELLTALAANKRVIPVVIRDVDQEELPEGLAIYNWVFCRNTLEEPSAFEDIIEALDSDLDWRDFHTRLSVRANEWLASDRDRSFLLRGKDLQRAESWYEAKDSHVEQPTTSQSQYIVTSRAAATRRTCRLLVVVLVALVASIGLSIYALIQRSHATAQAHRAESVAVAGEATQQLPSPFGILLSLESYRLSPTQQAINAIADATAQSVKGIFDISGGVAGTTAVTFAPTSQVVLSGTDSGHVVGTNLATGKSFEVMRNVGVVISVALSNDHKWLAVSNDAGDAFLDNLNTGGVTKISDGSDAVEVAISPNSKFLAVGGQSELLVRNLADGQTQSYPSLVGGGPVAFSPNSLVIAAENGTGELVDLINIVTGTTTTLNFNELVDTLAFSPDGGTLAAGTENGHLLLTDLGTGSRTTFSLGGEISGISYSPDGSIIASASGVNVLLTNVNTSDSTTINEGTAVSSAAISPNGKLLAVGGADGLTSVIQLGGGITTNEDIGSRISDVAVSPDGHLVATGTLNGSVQLTNLTTGSTVTKQLTEPGGGLESLCFSHNGRMFAVGFGGNGQTALVKIGGGVTNYHFADDKVTIGSVAFGPRDNTVISGGSDGILRITSVASGRTERVSVGGGSIQSLSSLPDGKIVSSNYDGKVILYDPQRRQITVLARLGGTVGGPLILVPHQNSVITTDNGGQVSLINLSNKLSRVITYADAPIASAAIAPNGRTLALGLLTGQLEIVNVTNGAESTLNEGTRIYGVSFAQRGTLLVVGHGSYLSRYESPIWTSSFSSLEKRLCGEVRNLALTHAAVGRQHPRRALRDYLSLTCDQHLSGPTCQAWRVLTPKGNQVVQKTRLIDVPPLERTTERPTSARKWGIRRTVSRSRSADLLAQILPGD